MTGDQPVEPGRFRLAPVIDGAAAWEWAVELDLTPIRLTADVVAEPAADLVLVTD